MKDRVEQIRGQLESTDRLHMILVLYDMDLIKVYQQKKELLL